MHYRKILFYAVNFICCLGISTSSQAPARNQVLVVSFDGMQSAKFEEFVANNPDCAFNRIIRNGVKADKMMASFPTLTFPNHFTLVTGLNIESHGIVANSLFDPKEDLRVNFIGNNSNFANEVRWWNQAEPIWLTARNQGLKTGTFFWVGSEVVSRTADIWMSYNGDFPELLRIDEVINWIVKFKTDLTFLYFSQPDWTGHDFGADSAEYMDKIKTADANIGYLINKLTEQRVYDDLNIIVLSDHGMTTLKNQSTILMQNYVDMQLINSTRTVYGVTSNVHPLAGNEQVVYESLKKIQHANVYYKHELPADLYYSKNDRIAPIVVMCDEGYILGTSVRRIKGAHGYDNKLASMHTIFLAKGPAFLKNSTLPVFKNVNVYPLLCQLTQIKCKPSNGTAEIFNSVLNTVASSSTKVKHNSFCSFFYLTLFFFTFKK